MPPKRNFKKRKLYGGQSEPDGPVTKQPAYSSGIELTTRELPEIIPIIHQTTSSVGPSFRKALLRPQTLPSSPPKRLFIPTQYECPNVDCNIIIVPAGRPVVFFGYCKFLCFGGSLRVDGYDVKNKGYDGDVNNMYSVCAPFYGGKPAYFESRGLESIAARETQIKSRLKEVVPEYERILHDWRQKVACILFIYRKPPVIIDLFRQLHEDKMFMFQNQWLVDPANPLFVESPNWSLYRLPSSQAIDNALLDMDQKRQEGQKLTILPIGGKGAGKSTLVRYLANRLLSSELPIYILDADIGQTEFTPAGCMSLWKVNKPLLDVPWSHQQTTFKNCYFFADISPADDIMKYCNIFIQLLNEFKESSLPGSILIINPMGWVEGAGLHCLQYIASWALPDYCFQMAGREKMPLLQLPNETEICNILKDFPLSDKKGHFLRCRPPSLNSAALRELRTIGYFSHLLTKPVLADVHKGKIFTIDFKDATFVIPEDLTAVDDKFFLASVNVQLVALCSSTEQVNARRLLERPYLPQIATLNAECPLLRCFGFGIVSGIDLQQKQILVISPISDIEMEKVTLLVRGHRITVPPIMCRTSNGEPALYATGPTNSVQTIDADLYSSLRTQRQEKFRRAHYPHVEQ